DEKIIKLLEDSPTNFTLGRDQLVRLRQSGASERLIAAMQKGSTSSNSDVGAFVIILDCSGSMKDPIEGGGNKWEAAQQAALDLVQSIPVGKSLAFIAYGRDVQRKCRSVDVLCPLKTLDASGKVDLQRTISSLQPLGHTPIALAL